MKVHATLAATLTDHDVTMMFGLVGDGGLFHRELHRRQGRALRRGRARGGRDLDRGPATRSREGSGRSDCAAGARAANTLGTLYSAVGRAPIMVIAADLASAKHSHAQKGDPQAMITPTGAITDEVHSARTAR